jgi:ubiquinone/menaquinone biosynthesis C-methylase UbiE
MPEPWPRIYREAPEIFEAFGRAEDPDGLIARRVLALAGLEGKRVLEIGAGTGRYSRAWASTAAEYVALEPSGRLLNLGRSAGREAGIQWVRGRGEALPFKQQSVDCVLATWVLAYLRPEACRRVLLEAQRALGAGGIWLVENHWTGPFQELRGRVGRGAEPGLERLLDEHGFQVVEVIETELRFPSSEEARRILGALCGPAVAERLERQPTSSLGHRVVLLHRQLP